MIIKECLICKKPIKASPSQLISKKFCSRECHNIWRSQNMKGENNPSFKGGVAIYTNGKRRGKPYQRWYIRGQTKKMPESKYIMEQLIGRPLNPQEIIHHINGDSLDNHPENLLLTDRKNHAYFHQSLFDINLLRQQVKELTQENALLKDRLISLSVLPSL